MRVLAFDARYAPEVEAAIAALKRDVDIDTAGTFPNYIGPDRRDDSRVGTIYIAIIEPKDAALCAALVDLPRLAEKAPAVERRVVGARR